MAGGPSEEWPEDAIPIREAAELARRRVETIRKATQPGRRGAPRLRCWRDGVTKIRFLSRSEVLRVYRARGGTA